MKNICRTLKLKKYRSKITEDICKETDGTNFMIIYDDNKWDLGDSWDVRKALENDHIRKISCIFDMNDRIVIQRDILINTDEIRRN